MGAPSHDRRLDSAFVALAEVSHPPPSVPSFFRLDAPLLTLDRRLAAASGPRCAFQVPRLEPRRPGWSACEATWPRSSNASVTSGISTCCGCSTRRCRPVTAGRLIRTSSSPTAGSWRASAPGSRSRPPATCHPRWSARPCSGSAGTPTGSAPVTGKT